MDIHAATQARGNFYRLIDSVADSHEPICITGRRNKVVMMGEEDFEAMQETLYLMSIRGMRESIMKGRTEPVEQCSDQLDW